MLHLSFLQMQIRGRAAYQEVMLAMPCYCSVLVDCSVLKCASADMWLLCHCRPSNPPSASDIIIDSMCEYALTGYGGTDLNEFEDLDVKQERDRKRKVKAAKNAKEKDT